MVYYPNPDPDFTHKKTSIDIFETTSLTARLWNETLILLSKVYSGSDKLLLKAVFWASWSELVGVVVLQHHLYTGDVDM